MEQFLVGYRAAGEALDVSPSTVKRLVVAGELEKLTIGRRALIAVSSIEAYYVRCMEAAATNGQMRRPDEIA